MEFCEKLKFIRAKLQMSQELLARELNVSFATINRLEKNKTLPSYNTFLNFKRFCEKNKIIFEGDN